MARHWKSYSVNKKRQNTKININLYIHPLSTLKQQKPFVFLERHFFYELLAIGSKPLFSLVSIKTPAYSCLKNIPKYRRCNASQLIVLTSDSVIARSGFLLFPLSCTSITAGNWGGGLGELPGKHTNNSGNSKVQHISGEQRRVISLWYGETRQNICCPASPGERERPPICMSLLLFF